MPSTSSCDCQKEEVGAVTARIQNWRIVETYLEVHGQSPIAEDWLAKCHKESNALEKAVDRTKAIMDKKIDIIMATGLLVFCLIFVLYLAGSSTTPLGFGVVWRAFLLSLSGSIVSIAIAIFAIVAKGSCRYDTPDEHLLEQFVTHLNLAHDVMTEMGVHPNFQDSIEVAEIISSCQNYLTALCCLMQHFDDLAKAVNDTRLAETFLRVVTDTKEQLQEVRENMIWLGWIDKHWAGCWTRANELHGVQPRLVDAE